MASEEQIRESLKGVLIPGIKRDLARLNIVREVTVSNQRVNITLASTALNADVQNWVRTKAKAVVEKYVPGFATHPQLAMVKSMSLEAVALFPEANISSDKLAAIIEDLSKIE